MLRRSEERFSPPYRSEDGIPIEVLPKLPYPIFQTESDKNVGTTHSMYEQSANLATDTSDLPD